MHKNIYRDNYYQLTDLFQPYDTLTSLLAVSGTILTDTLNQSLVPFHVQESVTASIYR